MPGSARYNMVMGNVAGGTHDRSTLPPTPALAVKMATSLEVFQHGGNLTY